MKFKFWALVLVFAAVFQTQLSAAEQDKINLRLFGKSVLDGYQGCSFALWQRNKDPEKNKFAYVFYVRFHDAQPMAALVKIGKTVLELNKVEMGLKDSGLSDKFQMYRDEKQTTTLLVEIGKEKRVGDDTIVSDAKLTFIQRNKFPFVMNVKGGFRCPANDNDSGAANADAEPAKVVQKVKRSPYLPPNLGSNAIRLGRKVELSKLAQFPRHVRRVVRDNGEACNLDNVPGAGSKYAISDAMTLWVVPCDLFASNSSVMLVTALNGTKHAIGLEIPKRPGKSGEPGYDMLWPVIHPRSGVVTVSAMGWRGDCGTVEHYQLIVVEGESVELKLLEVREKNDCNGVKVRPENLPLVYRAR